MQIRYNPVVAYIMLGLGLVNLALGLWLLALQDFTPSLFIGIMITVFGAMYLNRPYFYIEGKQIVLPALIGPVKRTFSFEQPDSLEVNDNTIRVNNGKNWKRVPVYRWMSHGEDWKTFIKELQSHS